MFWRGKQWVTCYTSDSNPNRLPQTPPRHNKKPTCKQQATMSGDKTVSTALSNCMALNSVLFHWDGSLLCFLILNSSLFLAFGGLIVKQKAKTRANYGKYRRDALRTSAGLQKWLTPWKTLDASPGTSYCDVSTLINHAHRQRTIRLQKIKEAQEYQGRQSANSRWQEILQDKRHGFFLSGG